VSEGWLEQRIHWRRSGDVYAPWTATYGDHELKLWLGDFPAEHFYILLVDGIEVLDLDSKWPKDWRRTVAVREVHDPPDHRVLWAYMEHNGDLALDAQDLGPSVEQVFGAGIREYEWKRTVAAAHIPQLITALGGTEDDVLDALEAWLPTHQPEDLEKLIEERGIPSTFWSRAGD